MWFFPPPPPPPSSAGSEVFRGEKFFPPRFSAFVCPVVARALTLFFFFSWRTNARVNLRGEYAETSLSLTDLAYGDRTKRAAAFFFFLHSSLLSERVLPPRRGGCHFRRSVRRALLSSPFPYEALRVVPMRRHSTLFFHFLNYVSPPKADSFPFSL